MRTVITHKLVARPWEWIKLQREDAVRMEEVPKHNPREYNILKLAKWPNATLPHPPI